MNSMKILLIVAICTLSLELVVNCLPFEKAVGDYDLVVAVDSYVTRGRSGKGNSSKMHVNSDMTILQLKEKVGTETDMGFNYLKAVGGRWQDMKCYHGFSEVKDESKTLAQEGFGPSSLIKFKMSTFIE